MSNCDFNGPCDCLDCREAIHTHICPKCEFPNKVSVIRDSRWVSDMKHGGGYYTFDAPIEPVLDLVCYNCGYCIKQVGHYTSVDESGCQHEKKRLDLIGASKICASCNKVEGLDRVFSGPVQLQGYGGRQLCQTCLIAAVKSDKPDPSDKDNKYEFNPVQLEWLLVRVRVRCKVCGKGYLVAVGEQSWRTRCKKCYSQSKG